MKPEISDNNTARAATRAMPVRDVLCSRACSYGDGGGNGKLTTPFYRFAQRRAAREYVNLANFLRERVSSS